MCDDASCSVSRDEASESSGQTFSLPLVSVIIINFNYGRYLRQSVASVKAQTYANIECIIVDNGSTDNSAELLHCLQDRYKDLTIVQRTHNAGQCAAAIDGYNISSGKYVVFLDADDALFPDFVANHILVHLSARKPVGFTSSDMLQADGNEIVVGTFQHLSDAIKVYKGVNTDPIRPFERAFAALKDIAQSDYVDQEDVVFVSAAEVSMWIWAPTSGNCFRRDALDLFMGCDALPTLKYALDTYLIRAIHSLTGCLLIDRPLSIYRIHGTNIFSKVPHLNGLISYDLDNKDYKEQLSRKIIIDHIVSQYARFEARFYSAREIHLVLRRINDIYPKLVADNGMSYYFYALANRGHIPLVAKSIARIWITLSDLRRIFARFSIFGLSPSNDAGPAWHPAPSDNEQNSQAV